MTGSEGRNLPAHAGEQPVKPEAAEKLEVVEGTKHEVREGWVPQLAGADDLCKALEEAFSYRGNVSITKKDGTVIEGYIFDRRTGATLSQSVVRLIPKNSTEKTSIAFSDIAALAFTGRDMAAGRQWENWVKTYWEKKAAGEQNIGLEPEPLE
jgi:hypothetical protein